MKPSQTKDPSPRKLGAHPEIKGLLILALTLFLFLSLFTFVHQSPEENVLGLIGYSVGLGLLYSFGLCSYLIAGFVGFIGWNFLLKKNIDSLGIKSLYFGICLLALGVLLNLFAEVSQLTSPILASHTYSEVYLDPYPYPHRIVRYNLGGVPLYYLYRDLPIFNLSHLLSNVGVGITFSLIGLMSFMLLTNIRLLEVLEKAWNMSKTIYQFLEKVALDFKPKKKVLQKTVVAEAPLQTPIEPVQAAPMPPEEGEETEDEEEIDSLKISTHLEKKAVASNKQKSHNEPYKGEFKRYRLPPLNLLTDAKKIDQPTLKKDLKKQAEILEETLLSFGVDGKVGQINCGPTITSFEVQPPIGVKVQKIKVLENDIALNLQAKSIRIIAPIPGKAAVGVEVPSLYPQEVGFKEMLSDYQKSSKKLHIPILLGQTVTGDNIVTDLTKMPHCIIAGATGSGKSVCINSIVMSILMTARPDEVKLLLVDPKKVELSSYTSIPHMIAPVITEAHGAYAALNFLVKEMQERYEILKRMGLRNITAFNNRKINPQKEEELGMKIPEKMPFLVAIIDEFADLMMASSSDLETPIARIAQMARAVGIHLILATQRPSREVITGLIKANFPTRIAFKVSSRVNSQIILDDNGAELLLGNGDLLFLPPGSSQLTRSQGVYIRDEDIHRIIEHVERQAGPNYLIKSFDQMGQEAMMGEDEPKDDLYDQAYTIVSSARAASTTFLQRKLKIGYARAASLMDELEARGVIGPQEGSRPRQVLVKEVD